jgi:hypothetical protein
MWKAVSAALQKLFESPQSLLILVGAALVGLGAAGGVTFNNWFPITQQWAQIFLSIVGLLLALLGVLLGVVKPPSATPYGISITSPTKGAHVHRTNVTGTIRKHPPKGYALWILRIYPDGSYVPLRWVDPPTGEGSWQALDCDIAGQPGDHRRLGAYLVGPSSQIMFDYFQDAAERHNRWMDQLNVPKDAKDRYLRHSARLPTT